MYPKWRQLEFYALALFQSDASLLAVHASYEWIRAKKSTARQYTRADIPALAQGLLGDMLAVEREAEWSARPNGLCRAYCPVTVDICEPQWEGVMTPEQKVKRMVVKKFAPRSPGMWHFFPSAGYVMERGAYLTW